MSGKVVGPQTGLQGLLTSQEIKETYLTDIPVGKSVTYYVRPDGNDLNDGSADTPISAFKTIEYAIGVALSKTTIINGTVTIWLGSGVYSPNQFELKNIIGNGKFDIAAYSSSNVTIHSENFYLKDNKCKISIRNITLAGYGNASYEQNIFGINNCNNVYLENITFGDIHNTYTDNTSFYVENSSIEVYSCNFADQVCGVTLIGSTANVHSDCVFTNDTYSVKVGQQSTLVTSPFGATLSAPVLLYDGGVQLSPRKSATYSLENDVTYTVNTGNTDGDDGSTTQFGTIPKVLSLLPPVINGNVTINVSPGLYDAQNIVISGFSGKGSISIIGESSATPSTYTILGNTTVAGIQISNCTCAILIEGLTATNNTYSSSFSAVDSTDVTFTLCQSNASRLDSGANTNITGVSCTNSSVNISYCAMSNKAKAISALNSGSVVVDGISGTGNVTGYYAITNSRITTVPAHATLVATGTLYTSNRGGMVCDGNGTPLCDVCIAGLDTMRMLKQSQIPANITKCTTANVSLYVSPTGSDSNDGSASDNAHALLTITAAIAKIPTVINHPVAIHVAAGTYAEDVLIAGFCGQGTICIQGGTDAFSSAPNFIVNSVTMLNCSCQLTVVGLAANSTTKDSFMVQACTFVYLLYCISRVTSTFAGITSMYGANVYTYGCIINNHGYGLSANVSSTITSNIFSGTGNTQTVFADNGSVIKLPGISNHLVNGATVNGGSILVYGDGTIGGIAGESIMGLGTPLLATTGTFTVQMDGSTKYFAPSGNCVVSASGGHIGQTCTFEIHSPGTTAYTITFLGNFASSGIVTTNTVANRITCVNFIYNGAMWVETGRLAVD